MKPPALSTASCPSVEGAFNLLGRKWTGLVIHALAAAPRHFREVQKAIPNVSARVLAARMRELESEGIVTRTVHTGTPVRVAYALTEKGRALVPVMRGIETWARAWNEPAATAPAPGAARPRLSAPRRPRASGDSGPRPSRR